MGNVSMDDRHKAPPNSLKFLADTPALSDQAPDQADNNQWKRTPRAAVAYLGPIRSLPG